MADLRDEIARLIAQVAALTARVYQLEQKSGGVQSRLQQQPQADVALPAGTMLQPPATQGVPGSAPSAQPPPASPPQYHAPSQPTFHSVSAKGSPDLEKKIGQYWLNRIGIVAILIGVSYFLKLAFENDWIGPAGRIAIGLLAGIGFVLWSERFRARGYAAFSYSLKAVGIGTLYLSLWGAFQIYHLIPAAAAFVAMIVVTASTIALALSQNAELLASFALIGGFATPILLSTGQNHEAVLFSYVCLLDAGILEMTAAKPWRRLLWGSFAGTMILYWGWYSDYYSQDQRALTIFFAALFAAIFAAIPLMTRYARSTRFGGPSITLTLLPLLNAAAFFLALYEMYRDQTATLTWFALALAAVYLGLANAFARRHTAEEAKVIQLLHVAIAIAFITIAIPLKLDHEWITIGWLIESAVLLFVSVKTRTNFLRYLAATALVLGVVRLLFFDRYNTETLIFNARFATYAVAIAVLGGIAMFGKRHASENEQPFLQHSRGRRESAGADRLDARGIGLFRPHDARGRGLRLSRLPECVARTRSHLFRDLAHLWRNPDGHRLPQPLSVCTLAGADFDCVHHRKSFHLRRFSTRRQLPDRQLHCAGRSAAGNFVRLSARLAEAF